MKATVLVLSLFAYFFGASAQCYRGKNVYRVGARIPLPFECGVLECGLGGRWIKMSCPGPVGCTFQGQQNPGLPFPTCCPGYSCNKPAPSPLPLRPLPPLPIYPPQVQPFPGVTIQHHRTRPSLIHVQRQPITKTTHVFTKVPSVQVYHQAFHHSYHPAPTPVLINQQPSVDSVDEFGGSYGKGFGGSKFFFHGGQASGSSKLIFPTGGDIGHDVIGGGGASKVILPSGGGSGSIFDQHQGSFEQDSIQDNAFDTDFNQHYGGQIQWGSGGQINQIPGGLDPSFDPSIGQGQLWGSKGSQVIGQSPNKIMPMSASLSSSSGSGSGRSASVGEDSEDSSPSSTGDEDSSDDSGDATSRSSDEDASAESSSDAEAGPRRFSAYNDESYPPPTSYDGSYPAPPSYDGSYPQPSSDDGYGPY